jgi:hypothetical protein
MEGCKGKNFLHNLWLKDEIGARGSRDRGSMATRCRLDGHEAVIC